VPIYLGATAPRAIELAGEIADGWFPFGVGPEAIAPALERIRAGARRAGRSLADFRFSSFIFTAVGDDDRAVREAMKPFLALVLGWFSAQPQLPIFTNFGLTAKDVSLIRQSYARGEVRPEMVSEAMIDGLALAGSPQRCRERLAQYIDAGIETAVFAIEGGPGFAKNLESLHRNLVSHFI
jgi:alkanesulfonate monooxygenase SsuD/methylene tetrahydromethanopterin reductase-like flavin-dependent oxidoreductase (luciferase family)